MRAQDKLLAMQIELARVTNLTAAEQIAGPLATIALGSTANLRWLAKQPPNLEAVLADLIGLPKPVIARTQVIEGVRSMLKNDSREKALLDVNEVIREVIALLRSELQNRQIVVQDELSPNLPPVLADGVQLQQVIAILVANAIEAMEAVDDRTLRVKSAKSEADGVLIMVEDSGPGIDPQNADRIYDQALGRSRGGFSTKIHLKTDFGGLPIAFHLTGGEASDSRNLETLLDIGPDLNPRAALGDKGYDFKSNRDAARQRGICPAIPYRSNTKDVPASTTKLMSFSAKRCAYCPRPSFSSQSATR